MIRPVKIRHLLGVIPILWFCSTNGSVQKFECGNDLCVPNEQYCNHEDSDDRLKWRCSPCKEENWKCKDLSIHPQCLGYCDRNSIDETTVTTGKEEMNHTKGLQSSTNEKDPRSAATTIIPYILVAGFALAVITMSVYYCHKRYAKKNRNNNTTPDEESMIQKCQCADAVRSCCTCGIKRGSLPIDNEGNAELCPNETNTKTDFQMQKTCK